MKILLLTHAFNGLAQRLYVELRERGHELSVEFDINDTVTREAIDLFQPELVIAPFLKRAIPGDIWRRVRCLVVHPGIRGDRGPSALDWAIRERADAWGVTLLQANSEMDAGDTWAAEGFAMREAAKSSLYRREVTEAATRCVLAAIERAADPSFSPVPLDPADPSVRGRSRPLMRQRERAIDWEADDTDTVLAKIHAADGFPGVLDEVAGLSCRLFGAWREPEGAERGRRPGEILATRDGAILRATRDGSVWISHLRQEHEGQSIKLPASTVLAGRLEGVPEAAIALDAPLATGGFRELAYFERGPVGFLSFEFHNGAMSTAQCRRLAEALRIVRERPTRVLVLLGGAEFWSNGIHLGTIEAAASPADESWENINAIDDVCLEILSFRNKMVISALRANGGAGGVFVALAADAVWARNGVILNPHYKNMGNLFGSEYWTYLLPRRVGADRAGSIMNNRLPIGAEVASRLGLVDSVLGGDSTDFDEQVAERAAQLATADDYAAQRAARNKRRDSDAQERPLAAYRAAELERMRLNFYGFDPSYHVARHRFVYRTPHSWTPRHLAAHRRLQQTP
jgi:putative two-component system hydrogenase maturation factor HypX/HoxX